MRSIQLLFSLSLFIVHSLFWTILFNSNIGIPVCIPNTSIHIGGLIIILIIVLFGIVYARYYLKRKPGASIFEIVFTASMIYLFSEILFQLVRVYFNTSGSFMTDIAEFTKSVILSTLYAGLLILIITLQMTKRKKWVLTLIGLVFVLSYIYNQFRN